MRIGVSMDGKEWWRGAVIYQVYPRSYQDTNGTGVGDLAGVTRRLDHIASLGVDAVWLSPIFTSPMKDMGYDVADYTDIDPLFGTLAEFDALVARAHDLGLKVIIDQVISHSSDKHPFFTESRRSRDNQKSDWYVWADPKPDGSPPNNWPSVFGGPAWEWEPRRRQYYLHNFLAEQPDWNIWNPDVQDYLLGTMRFWLERGVDGFRLDTVNYYIHDRELRDNPPAEVLAGSTIFDTPRETYGWQDHVYSKDRPENIGFLKRMRALTDEFPDRMMVGEVGEAGDHAIQIMAEYTEGSDKLHMCYSFEFLGQRYGAAFFRHALDGFFKGAPHGHPCWSFSNHDVVRHISRFASHGASPDALARQTLALMMGFEGAIGIYQGEELGLPEAELDYSDLTDPPGLRFWPEVKGRDGCRTPMVWQANAPHGGFSEATPWLPVKAPHLERAVDAQEAANDSLLHAYREVIGLRQSRAALRHGTTRFVDTPEPVLAFHREAGNDTLTCIYNLSPTPVTATLAASAQITGPAAATLDGHILTLPANGFAFLDTGTADAVGIHVSN
jgi:alpha-glucosidase